jgi:hypothetical protein
MAPADTSFGVGCRPRLTRRVSAYRFPQDLERGFLRESRPFVPVSSGYYVEADLDGDPGYEWRSGDHPWI